MGKLKFILVVLIFSNQALSLVPENFFQDDAVLLEQLVLSQKLTKMKLTAPTAKDVYLEIINDPDKRVDDIFIVPEFFKDSVHFWFNIYTLYDSHHAVIHDKGNLAIVYDVLEFTELKSSVLNIHTKTSLQSQLTLNKISAYKEAMKKLSLSRDAGDLGKKILLAFDKAQIKVPKQKSKRRAFFGTFANSIRAQTGQKDNIFQGLVNYQDYRESIDRYFHAFNLPKELLAIAFLESSFNPHAESKVGASGVWQFMPFIAKHFMPVDDYQDARRNPLISSISAMFLLKQNFSILKRWDLAVPAYNSGTKHLIKAKKMLKHLSVVRLEDIIRHYDHPHFGFASQNFYSEFLALVYSLAYQDRLFLTDDAAKNSLRPHLKVNHANIHAYVSLCPLRPASWFKEHKAKSPELSALNRHIFSKSLNRSFPRGTILYSDIDLKPGGFFKLTTAQMSQSFPKNWINYAKAQSCSTR